jgi:NAD(P)-dependent dehydrogenase (short-subunit alcohol dehydrogenase family)
MIMMEVNTTHTVDEAKLRDVIEFLEQLGANMGQLAELDEPVRVRLVSAAGQLARPDRYQKKALGKALHRAHKQARKDADQAVLNQTGIRLLRKETVFKTPLPRPDMALESRGDDEQADAWAEAEATRYGRDSSATRYGRDSSANRPPDEVVAEGPRVQESRLCYVCKSYFNELHHFYDLMCPACATLNWEKRNATADLRGRTALVTGGRVKIGYQAAIKLLRAGAEVIVATRFPRDAARRFAKEPDASEWTQRLHVYGIDLRHTPSVELLCRHLLQTLPRLDALINNACQTVRRPSGWYDHVVEGENETASALERAFLERDRSLRGELAAINEGEHGLVRAAGAAIQAAGLWKSAVLSQVPLVAEDLERGEHLYPTHRLDQDLQQIDLRDKNTWRMTLAEVPTAELLEVHLVNAVAPFVLNARLRPLLAAVPTRDAHVVNVSAMEGQFYRRWKTDKHPHTNMAKAALNMMTRTSAIDYVQDGIHMNSVDTGWVTDEDPLHHAERKTRLHGFHPPLDIVDGAARIVDPVFDGVTTGNHLWGLFLKDYKPAPW